MKEGGFTKARGQWGRRLRDSGGTPSTRTRPVFVLHLYWDGVETPQALEHNHAEPNAPLPLPPDNPHRTRCLHVNLADVRPFDIRPGPRQPTCHKVQQGSRG